MAEDLIELGLEGFDRLVDKYHDKAYEGATDGAGIVWRKMRVPGFKKPVYVEQNPNKGEKPEIYDPAKDERPEGFKKDPPQQRRDDRDAPRPNDRNAYNDGYKYERGRCNDQREPVRVNEREYFGNDNLDSPRTRYPNEMLRDTHGGYPPPPAQPGTHFPPPPQAPMNDYGSPPPPPQPGYNTNVGQYLAPAVAGAMYGQPQYSPENRGYPRDQSPNYLGRQRSYDGRPRRDDSDSEFSPPYRRQTRSVGPRDRSRNRDRDRDRDRDRRKSKDYSLGASLAGAVAGGLLGRSLGKGDLVTTVAGGVVGALGGDILADKKSSRDKRSDRDKYNKDKYNDYNDRDYDKDYGRDYVYKDRY